MNILFYEKPPTKQQVKALAKLEEELVQIEIQEICSKLGKTPEEEHNKNKQGIVEMNRITILNSILEKWGESPLEELNFNPYHDKLGRFTTGPSGGWSGAGTVTTGSLEQPKIGVGGNDSLRNGLTKVPRLSNLKGRAKALENEVVKCYENGELRDKIINEVIEDHNIYKKDKNGKIVKDKNGKPIKAGEDKTYEVDGIKEKLPGWNNVDGYKWSDLNEKINTQGYENLTAKEKKAYDTMAENRMKYNTVYHNTASALAKAAFEAKVAQLRSEGKDVNIMMTGGGCGVGKGFGLDVLTGKNTCTTIEGTEKAKQSLLKDNSRATLVYDAAGEACNSEAYWVMNLAIANGGKFTLMNTVSTAGDLTEMIAKNQAKRTATKGRTVAAQFTADSYSLGATNAEKFSQDKTVQSLISTGQVSVYTIKNGGPGGGALQLSEGIDISGASKIDVNKFVKDYQTGKKGISNYWNKDNEDGKAMLTDKMVKDTVKGLLF